MKDACCPLCKKSLNRRNISKDDDLQTYIEKFKNLVTAIQNDTNIEYTERKYIAKFCFPELIEFRLYPN